MRLTLSSVRWVIILCNPVYLIQSCFVVINLDVLEIIYEKQKVEGKIK